jgi:hypothetical protein
MRRIRVRPTLLAAVAGFACLAGLVPVSAMAGASPAPRAVIPDGMSALTYHRMVAQIPLDDAATRIRQAVARPGQGHAGLVQIWVDDDHNQLTVYWHGTVPADIARLLASLRHRVQVRVAAARYSTAQLDQAVSRVFRSQPGVRVTMAGPLPDGSGIEVGIAGTARAAAALRLPHMGVAVKIVTRPPLRPATCHQNSAKTVPSDTLGPPARCNDLPPGFWGGAVIINQVHGNGCSTGFGVHSTVDSKQYMLTASHCGNDRDSFKNGQETQTLGNMYGENHAHDDGAILTSPGNAYYDGPGIFKGDTHNTKLVAGEQPSNKGDWVCESGAYGGVMCSMQITALNLTYSEYDPDDGNTYIVSRIAETTLGSGGDNGGLLTDGDSGGPVFSLAANNKVTAKGINLGVGASNDFMTIDWVSSDFKVQVNTG